MIGYNFAIVNHVDVDNLSLGGIWCYCGCFWFRLALVSLIPPVSVKGRTIVWTLVEIERTFT